MTDDDALVSATLRGEEDAFRLLVERYRVRLHALARGILQDSDQASDAVQDTFLRAYTSLGEYRGRNAFAGWIRRILVNHCLSLLRQRHQYLSLEELEGDLCSEARGPEEEVLGRSEADEIRRAMSRLPAHYRTALTLRVVEGLSYREIAALMGVPDSTIETWLHRGRLRLREQLQRPPGRHAGSEEPASGERRPGRTFRLWPQGRSHR